MAKSDYEFSNGRYFKRSDGSGPYVLDEFGQGIFIGLSAFTYPSALWVQGTEPTPDPGATHYYVNPAHPSASNANAGTNINFPWLNLNPTDFNDSFPAGAVINIARGSTFSKASNWYIWANGGTPSLPIIIRPYGSGALPHVIRTGGGTFDPVIDFYSNGTHGCDNIIMTGIKASGAGFAAIQVASGSSDIVIQNCELTGCGTGVYAYGPRVTVINNHMHDFNMIVNDAGGDNDFGANALWAQASDFEAAYNLIENARAPSLDYGYDGGALEVYADAALSNILFHHNWVSGCTGVVETGGTGAGSITNLQLHHNLCLNNRGHSVFHNSAVPHLNVDIYNETIVEELNEATTFGSVQYDALPSGASEINVRDSIFALNNGYGVFQHIGGSVSSGWRSNNVLPGNVPVFTNGVNTPLGTGEVRANPLFVNQASRDFRTLAGRPLNVGAFV